MALKQGTQELAQKLLGAIYTTTTLKLVSDSLEDLSQNRAFKSHADSIVSDPTLNDAQKRTQLSYVLRVVELPVLYDFLMEAVTENQWWIFATNKTDRFDTFVQTFQLLTEKVGVVFLTTAVRLTSSQLKNIATDLSQAFGYQVIIDHEVNPHILGGIQVRSENMVFDFSLRTKFRQFQTQWLTSLDKTQDTLVSA